MCHFLQLVLHTNNLVISISERRRDYLNKFGAHPVNVNYKQHRTVIGHRLLKKKNPQWTLINFNMAV